MVGGMCGRGRAWLGACMVGVCVGDRGCMVGGMHGGGGACMARGMWWGHAWQGSMHGRGVHDRGQHEIRLVNVQSVCILLECTFVDFIFFVDSLVKISDTGQCMRLVAFGFLLQNFEKCGVNYERYFVSVRAY